MDDNKSAILNKSLILLHFNYTYVSIEHQDHVMNINFIIYYKIKIVYFIINNIKININIIIIKLLIIL